MKDIFTPRGLVVRAVVFASLFAAAHLAGWRTYTSILCSTTPDGGSMQMVNAFLALTYILLYLLTVVASPILLLAALLLHLKRGRV